MDNNLFIMKETFDLKGKIILNENHCDLLMDADSPVPQPDCLVSETFSRFLRLLRLAGIAPLHIVKERNGWRISFSQGWRIYGYFLGYACTILLIVNLFGEMMIADENRAFFSRTKKNRIVHLTGAALMILITGTVVHGASKRIQLLIACLNELQKINFSFHNQNWPTEFRKSHVWFCICWMTTLAVITAINIAIGMYIFDCRFDNLELFMHVTNIFYCVCYWMIHLFEIQFIATALYVERTFNAINDRLSLLQDDVDFLRYRHETVRQLSLAYVKVCDVVCAVNHNYGPLLMMVLIFLVYYLITSPYFLINYIVMNHDSDRVLLRTLSIIMVFMWCLNHVITLVTIVEPSHLTQEQMETTRRLVSELICNSHSANNLMKNELDAFFKRLTLCDVSYKPMNVTTMSRALIISILGSITTYLVIVVQL